MTVIHGECPHGKELRMTIPDPNPNLGAVLCLIDEVCEEAAHQ